MYLGEKECCVDKNSVYNFIEGNIKNYFLKKRWFIESLCNITNSCVYIIEIIKNNDIFNLKMASTSQVRSRLIKSILKAVFEVMFLKVTLCKLQSSDCFEFNSISVILVNVIFALKTPNVSDFICFCLIYSIQL